MNCRELLTTLRLRSFCPIRHIITRVSGLTKNSISNHWLEDRMRKEEKWSGLRIETRKKTVADNKDETRTECCTQGCWRTVRWKRNSGTCGTVSCQWGSKASMSSGAKLKPLLLQSSSQCLTTSSCNPSLRSAGRLTPLSIAFLPATIVSSPATSTINKLHLLSFFCYAATCWLPGDFQPYLAGFYLIYNTRGVT